MLFIDKSKKIAPNIYIIDIGGYFSNVFEGLFIIIDPKQMLLKQPLLSNR